MTERKATITVTGEVIEKDFETLVSRVAQEVNDSLKSILGRDPDVSISKSQTPGGQFDFEYEIVAKVPEPEPEEA